MIVAAALRLLAVQALRDRTLAGTRIFSSDPSFLGADAIAERQPFVCVYSTSITIPRSGSGLLGRDVELELVFECIAPGPADGLGPSDEALELTVDLLVRQVAIALGDPSDPWAARYQRLATFANGTILAGRSGSSEDGVRFAARQLTVTLRLLLEPVPGQPNQFWSELVAALEAEEDPSLAAYASTFRAALEGSRKAWERAALMLGWSAAQAEALGTVTDEDARVPADVVAEFGDG
jgi:hypothetical protein